MILRDFSHLTKQNLSMGVGSQRPGLEGPCRIWLAFILQLRGRKRLGSSAASQVGQHSYYFSNGADVTLAVTKAEFSRARAQ